jgi:hypothetical protein
LTKHAGRYRRWAELLKRTFDIEVLDCPNCHRRMKLLAMITDYSPGTQALNRAPAVRLFRLRALA